MLGVQLVLMTQHMWFTITFFCLISVGHHVKLHLALKVY